LEDLFIDAHFEAPSAEECRSLKDRQIKFSKDVRLFGQQSTANLLEHIARKTSHSSPSLSYMEDGNEAFQTCNDDPQTTLLIEKKYSDENRKDSSHIEAYRKLVEAMAQFPRSKDKSIYSPVCVF
jgi:hypothetical protein